MFPAWNPSHGAASVESTTSEAAVFDSIPARDLFVTNIF
jgi:hypothetical protein